MQWRDLGRLLACVLMTGAVVAGTGSPASAAGACAAPERVPVPSAARVVGSGTAAGCTEAALRRAVLAGGHVTFACGGPATIAVTSELKVTRTTVIDGAGRITLDGRHAGRILHAMLGATLSVRNLRLVNGGTAGMTRGGAIISDFRNRIETIGSTFQGNTATEAGGAISMGSGSRLTVVGSTFRGNTADSSTEGGGAIYSPLTRLTVVNSTFIGNRTTAYGNGGAILTDGAAAPDEPGTIRFCGAVFRGNSAHGSGGAAFVWSYAPQQVIVDRTTFDGNTTVRNAVGDGSFGGAARLAVGLTDKHRTGTLIVQNSSVLSNTTPGGGGGFYLDCPPICRLSNTTFYGNRAGDLGGALFGDGHSSRNVTYADNHAGQHGGAVFGKNATYDSSVFAGNTAGNPWGMNQTCSAPGRGAHVLQWGAGKADSSQKCVPAVLAKNPRLGRPAANGGPTLTMLPAAGSGVLGAGRSCPSTDQRGTARPKTTCDLGAVQRTPVPPASSAPAAVTSAVASAAGTTKATQLAAGASVAAPPERSRGPLLATLGGTALGVTALLALLVSRRRRQH